MSDFFESDEGGAASLRKDVLRRRRSRDLWYDLRLSAGAGLRRIRAAAASRPPARVLVVGIEVPSRADDIHQTVRRLTTGSRHEVTVSIAPMQNRGKFDNIEAAIEAAPRPLASYDWLVITDDDIALRPHALDDMIEIAAQSDLALAQPAHAFFSHATYTVTQRQYGTLSRRTDFVEIGPLTLIRADLFADLIPFPPSRWCYGIDLVWSVAARRAGRSIGIIDGTPIRHLRPVATSYDMEAARTEGKQLIGEHGITDNRADLFRRNQPLLMA